MKRLSFTVLLMVFCLSAPVARSQAPERHLFLPLLERSRNWEAPTLTPTPTPSPMPSATPTLTITPTPTATPTNTHTATRTVTPAATPTATPTSTVAPTQTPTASPTPTTVPGWVLYFADDFSDPSSGWQEVAQSWTHMGYYQGEYRIVGHWGGFLYRAYCPFLASDFVAEVTARQVTGASAGYGLGFGLAVDGNETIGYSFAVNGRSYCLYKYVCDWGICEWQAIANWTSSTRLYGPPQANRLKVTRKGSEITLHANGYLLGTWYDSTYTGERWLALECDARESDADVRFDDFALYRWSSAAHASGSAQ